MMAGRGATSTGAAGGPARHIPVMLSEVLDCLEPRDGGIYIDGTFGAGGYAQAILEAADCILVAIDRDPQAISEGAALKDSFGDRLRLTQGSFAEMDTLAARQGIARVNGVALDLGVSSMQIDRPERGFSFQEDGPLDMRMSREGPSAADIVNALTERDLADIIFVLGEERRARAIARAIVAARANRPIERTGELVDIVVRVLGRRRDEPRHPATRTFQALRMYVNAELDELAHGLIAAERLLAEGGRLVAVTFHSLEDRVVKRFLAVRSGKTPRPSRHLPEAAAGPRPTFRLLHRRALTPGKAEVERNPRARSARLRAGERTDAPPLPPDLTALGVPRLPALRH